MDKRRQDAPGDPGQAARRTRPRGGGMRARPSRQGDQVAVGGVHSEGHDSVIEPVRNRCVLARQNA